MKVFWKRVLTGAALALALGFLVLAAFDAAEYNREMKRLQERGDEAGKMLEEYGNRDAFEFLDDVPGVRGAADRGIEGFRRRREEILQRGGGAGDS